MTRIAPSPVTPKSPRVKDSDYMGYIAALGGEQGAGCACGCKRSPCQVAHVKYGEPCPGRGFTRPCHNGWVLAPLGTHVFVHEACRGTGYIYGKKHGLRLDRWTLPLFHECHLMHEGAQHEHNERDWWKSKDIDPLALCKRLQDIYDNNPLPRAIELGTEAAQEVRK